MSDIVLWISGGLIFFVFAGTIWLNRRRMKAEVTRMRGGNPDFQALAMELKRTNDILEKTLENQEARLKALEDGARSTPTHSGSTISKSLN